MDSDPPRFSSCDEHDWWSARADEPCPHCAALADALAELQWCDAERRLALRALAEYAPVCMTCDDEIAAGTRTRIQLATGNRPLLNTCDEHAETNTKPLPHAAQIAAADEEFER